MNRYQLEVAAMDHRHQVKVRWLTFSGAALLMMCALWAADFRVGPIDLTRVRQSLRDWRAEESFPERDERQALAPQLPRSVDAGGNGQSAAEAVLPGTDSSTSEVPLPLILVQTEPGRNPREGAALIGTVRENPQKYAAGALLANGARIVGIHIDHVVLERNGKSAKLYVNGAGPDSEALQALVMIERLPIAAAKPTSDEILTDYIRPNPIYDAQGLKGYEVYSGRRSGVFAQFGLQNGDIIMALDDLPLTDPHQAIGMFRQLTAGVAVVATIDRKGSIERLSLDGALITQDQDRMRDPSQSTTDPAYPPGM